MAAARKRVVRAQAAEGFFLHCLVAMHMSAIASKALGSAGFSLTKHRILGFATLTPGITVGALVRAMRVTPQSLHAPLRRLIDEGYVVAKIGDEDRRHKRLFATRKGGRLYLRVLGKNLDKVEQTFRAMGPKAVRGFLEVHRQLVEPNDLRWIERASRVVEKNASEL